MSQSNPVQILRGLNMSLNSQDLQNGEDMINEQREAGKPMADRSRANLKRACQNVARALDTRDNEDGLAAMLEELRQQLGLEPSGEVSTHSQRYIINGRVTQFVPVRKPSPKPW